MANAVLCKSCGNWIHGRCTKINRVTNRMPTDFICWKYNGCHKNVEVQEEKVHDVVGTVTDFSYIGNRINSGSGCEAAVAFKTRLRWVKFSPCQDFLCRKIFI